MSEEHVQISARIPVEHERALQAIAEETDRSFSAVLRRAIRLYLAAREERRVA